MPKSCPTCSRTSNDAKFFGSFCEYCSRDKLSAKLNAVVEVTWCKRCMRIRGREGFVAPAGRNFEEIMGSRFKGYSVHLVKLNRDSALLDIAEMTPDGPLSVEKEIGIRYNKTLCDTCYKKSSSYYEAVVQLRGNPAKMERMIASLERYFERRKQFVSKIEKEDNGFNVYLSDKRMASEFMASKRLKPNMSYTLAGIKGGKKIYKNTYALHL
ncbi:MAG: hypothetical protein KGH74_03000 [Candidatus Micrarchaeota archaeon]|nr:hypothetical protein [Candidatus Micrarchaeota archaeon]